MVVRSIKEKGLMVESDELVFASGARIMLRHVNSIHPYNDMSHVVSCVIYCLMAAIFLLPLLTGFDGSGRDVAFIVGTFFIALAIISLIAIPHWRVVITSSSCKKVSLTLRILSKSCS